MPLKGHQQPACRHAPSGLGGITTELEYLAFPQAGPWDIICDCIPPDHLPKVVHINRFRFHFIFIIRFGRERQEDRSSILPQACSALICIGELT